MAKESQNMERTGKMKFPSTFLLLLAAALFAATPAAAQYQSHFTPATGFVNNMNVLGPITLDGTELTSTAYEIGAFCGDECRGSAFLEDFGAVCWALQTIVGNPGETITFALYDHAADKEIEANCSTTVEFETNATIGFDSAFTIAFSSKPSHVIAVAANPATGGTATGGGTVDAEATCTVTATANEHWAFVNWTEDGEEVSTAASYAFTVEANRNLVANFRRKSLVVVTSAVSRAFTLDTREGPFESDGTETVAFSSLWHGTADSSVTLLANGEPFAEGLSGESNYVWRALVNGTNVLTHVTVGVDNVPETAIFVVSGLGSPMADLTAEIAWKLLEATGTYFAQLKVTCTNGLSAGVSDLKFMFADRVGADGKNEAVLWNTPARSANANTMTAAGKEYRFVALDPALITAENTPVVYGVSNMSASSIPVNERTIELYVRRRVNPQAGNESAANVDNFVGYVVWSSGGENLSLPVAAGAVGRALGAAGLSTASNTATLPSPKRLNTALAVGVMPEEDGEPYCRFSEFSVDGDTIRGKIEVGADGQAGSVGQNARLVLLGGDSPGGALADLCTVDVGSDGSFSVPAPKDARFFKLALEIGEVAE